MKHQADRSLIHSLLILLVLVAMAALCFGSNPIVKDSVAVSTPYGTFDFKNVSVASNQTISGTVVNNTTRIWKYAQFLVYLKDKKGNFLTMSRGGRVSCSVIADIRNLAKGQTGYISSDSSTCIREKFVDFDIQFNADISQFLFSYEFTLVTPTVRPSPTYYDETIMIVFSPSDQNVAFALENRSMFPISLDWDHMAYVDFEGSSHRVIHQGIRLIQRDAPQSPTIVPPYSKVTDFLYPADLVSWGSAIGEWIQPPIWSSIPSPGQMFRVFMPVEVNGTTNNYLFTIKVADVRF